MPIMIRPINRSDFAAVAALLTELGRPSVTAETHADLQEVFWHHVDRENTFSLLAQVDGEPAGFLSLEIRYRLNFTTREAWIPDFVVTEKWRRKRVGHRLFEEARQIALARNCHTMVLESGHQRTIAHSFYEAHGMNFCGRYYVLELTR